MERLKSYQRLLVEKTSLLVSLQDRDELSPTYGCFDRTYWQWKFIDFPDARFQEALLTLSYAYSYNFEGNIFYRNQRLLDWLKAGFLFWIKIQHRDGSFDEAYPYERSFVAVGFGLFYLTEAFVLMENFLDKDIKGKIISAFNKAADWIMTNDETHAFISNHRLAACAGLFTLSKISSNKKYEDSCWDIWRSVKENQSIDGWFSEYGGADPGYLTQGIYYAAILYKKSGNNEVIKSLDKALEFIKYFIHPDGSLGGEYGSRNTEFYFPGGFEILAFNSPIAEAICRKLITSMEENRIPSINTVDIYNMIPIANSIVSGCLYYSPNNTIEPLPYLIKSDFVKFFTDFKILVKKVNNLYLIVGISKGGVLKVFDLENNKLIQSSVGVFANIDGKVVTSQYFYKEGLKVEINEDIVTIEGNLVIANYSLLTPLKIIYFRIFSILNKFFPIGSKYLKKLIVNILIFKKMKTNWRFKRTIYLPPKNEIQVVTECRDLPPGILKEMRRHTSYHMGSSKYFEISDLY